MHRPPGPAPMMTTRRVRGVLPFRPFIIPGTVPSRRCERPYERAKRARRHGALFAAKRRTAHWCPLAGADTSPCACMEGAPVSERSETAAFPELDDDQLSVIAAYGQRRTVQPGDILFS